MSEAMKTAGFIKNPAFADDTHANPIIAAWDAANDAQRQEFVKLRGAEIGRAGEQADPFAVPDFLRRTALPNTLTAPRRSPSARRSSLAWRAATRGSW